MQVVIGEYASQATAEAAVRHLQARGLSIQNVLIVDQQHRVWRKPQLRGAGKKRDRTGFVVLMLDGTERVEQARRWLRAYASKWHCAERLITLVPRAHCEEGDR